MASTDELTQTSCLPCEISIRWLWIKHLILYYLQSCIIHRTSSSMSFFGIQVGLLQVAVQNADAFVSHQFCQGEDIRAVSQHGKRKGSSEIVQCRFFHAGFLRSAIKNSPQPVITQTLRTEALLVHVAVVMIVFYMIAQFEIVFETF